jgi:hypothetical protein
VFTRHALCALLVVSLAIACSGGGDDAGERFEFGEFEGGFFDEPDYRRIYAMCRPGRLQVKFDPDSKTEVAYQDGEPVVSLSAEEAVIGCADAGVDDRVSGFQQRGISTVRESVELECRTERPIDIEVDPLFGRGEQNVVGGSVIVSTPARNVAARILVASTFDDEDDRSTLSYRTGRCTVTEN